MGRKRRLPFSWPSLKTGWLEGSAGLFLKVVPAWWGSYDDEGERIRALALFVFGLRQARW